MTTRDKKILLNLGEWSICTRQLKESSKGSNILYYDLAVSRQIWKLRSGFLRIMKTWENLRGTLEAGGKICLGFHDIISRIFSSYELKSEIKLLVNRLIKGVSWIGGIWRSEIRNLRTGYLPGYYWW